MTQQELIRERMEAIGMSWYALARDTGVKAPTIHHFKTGRFNFRDPEIVEPITKLLEIDRDTFYMAGDYLPPDVHKGLIQHPELIPIVRTLLHKVGYLER